MLCKNFNKILFPLGKFLVFVMDQYRAEVIALSQAMHAWRCLISSKTLAACGVKPD